VNNSSIISATIGSVFFGASYWMLPATFIGLPAFIPSFAIGVAAYGAAQLVFSKKDKTDEITEPTTLEGTLSQARRINGNIYSMIAKVEDADLKKNIKEINDTCSKIIKAVEKNPEKLDKSQTFFSYYLPVTLNVLKKYDDIENQNLSTTEVNKFLQKTKDMVGKVNDVFKQQLENLYQTEIVDTDAEMKVFNSMLQSDGFGSAGVEIPTNKVESEGK
jgi:5-bromo-4-chloroindolyl phosphate hydrolysis protein